MGAPTLEGAAGIFRYEDLDGAMAKMRECLRGAIERAGGRAAEGSDWSQARPLPGLSERHPAAHIPNIVHSTALRWRQEPEEQEVARKAFAQVAKRWEPLDIEIPSLRVVIEDVPYMHIPEDDAHVWWESEPRCC